MNNFLILHPTGLLYRFLHKISIFKPKSMKFGKHCTFQKRPIKCVGMYISFLKIYLYISHIFVQCSRQNSFRYTDIDCVLPFRKELFTRLHYVNISLPIKPLQ